MKSTFVVVVALLAVVSCKNKEDNKKGAEPPPSPPTTPEPIDAAPEGAEAAGPHLINGVVVGEAGTVDAIGGKLEGYTVDKGETQMDDGVEIGSTIEVKKDDKPVATILVAGGKIQEIKIVDPTFGVEGTQTFVGKPLADVATIKSCVCMGEDGHRGFYCDIGDNTHLIYETKDGDCSFTTDDEARAAVKERSVTAIARVLPPEE